MTTSITELPQAVPINLQLADVRQALFDEAKSDPAAASSLRYEAGRAIGIMGNAMDIISDLVGSLHQIEEAGLGGYLTPELCADIVTSTITRTTKPAQQGELT